MIAFFEVTQQLSAQNNELDKYTDSIFKYEVVIPSWLTVRETGSPKKWGGTLPKRKGIENAIMVRGYYKNEFESFKDFQNKVVLKNVIGKPMQMKNATLIWKNDLGYIEGIGKAYLQYSMFKGTMIHSQDILAEIKHGYLLINFTATDKTYKKNVKKFEEFLAGFKIIEK